ncbi:hypothetical protein EDF56_1159 [Novosphingobium sp. PhB165]|nr:hypothetical protein EDF56_1159 [Novosphingobium sp. PhB165]
MTVPRITYPPIRDKTHPEIERLTPSYTRMGMCVGSRLVRSDAAVDANQFSRVRKIEDRRGGA